MVDQSPVIISTLEMDVLLEALPIFMLHILEKNVGKLLKCPAIQAGREAGGRGLTVHSF